MGVLGLVDEIESTILWPETMYLTRIPAWEGHAVNSVETKGPWLKPLRLRA